MHAIIKKVRFSLFAALFCSIGVWGNNVQAQDNALKETFCTNESYKDTSSIVTVYFDVDSTVIKDEFKSNLDRFANLAKSKFGACVIGQADKQGNAAYNMELAKKRAAAIRQYLAQKGVPNNRMWHGSVGEAFTDKLFEFLKPQDQDRKVTMFLVDNDAK